MERIRKTKIFAPVVGLIILFASNMKHSNDFEKTNWLIGTWENKTPKGSIYETWSKVNKNELSGKSYKMTERDTVVFERIRLVQEQEGLYYIPVVKDQNDGLPVRFAAVNISETQLVFENRKHDFPQIITYTKITSDSMVAEVSGTTNGEERKVMFPMKRLQ